MTTRYIIDLTDEELDTLVAVDSPPTADDLLVRLWHAGRLRPQPALALTIEFGENTDDDALHNVLDKCVGYVLTIDDKDVWLLEVAPAGRWSLMVCDFDPEDETEHQYPYSPPPEVDRYEINLDLVDVLTIN